MSFFSIVLYELGLVFVYVNCWFIYAVINKRNDVMDVAWGIGFIFVALTSLLGFSHFEPRALLVSLLITIWGLRLAIHIYTRNKKKKEDWRYKKWREEWGKWFYLRTYGQVFLLQGLLLWIIALPIVYINQSHAVGLTLLDFLGLCVWGIGFFFEAIGDWQLRQFISQPKNKGKIMMSGLWRYTRHPNYFGEVTQWWGIYLIVFSLPFGWAMIISPLLITFLILYVSGIPMLEKKWEDNKTFQAYKKRTSAFFPLLPKK